SFGTIGKVTGTSSVILSAGGTGTISQTGTTAATLVSPNIGLFSSDGSMGASGNPIIVSNNIVASPVLFEANTNRAVGSANVFVKSLSPVTFSGGSNAENQFNLMSTSNILF